MAEAAPSADGDSLSVIAAAALLDTLRVQGAATFDPVGWRFIEALARRAAALSGTARRRVDARLHAALVDLNARLLQARATPTAVRAAPAAPGPLAELLAYIGRQEETLVPGSRSRGSAFSASPDDLFAPIDDQEGAVPPDPAVRGSAQPVAPGELKALRLYRDTWSRLSVDQQLAQSLAQGPKDAGPLNSHHLVVQALQHMRAVSPEYLKRFLAYAETLLWLDGANPAPAPAPRSSGRSEGSKKRRSGRGTTP